VTRGDWYLDCALTGIDAREPIGEVYGQGNSRT
jgi:hypothetical protein